jgi:hypothetical protein
MEPVAPSKHNEPLYPTRSTNCDAPSSRETADTVARMLTVLKSVVFAPPHEGEKETAKLEFAMDMYPPAEMPVPAGKVNQVAFTVQAPSLLCLTRDQPEMSRHSVQGL